MVGTDSWQWPALLQLWILRCQQSVLPSRQETAPPWSSDTCSLQSNGRPDYSFTFAISSSMVRLKVLLSVLLLPRRNFSFSFWSPMARCWSPYLFQCASSLHCCLFIRDFLMFCYGLYFSCISLLLLRTVLCHFSPGLHCLLLGILNSLDFTSSMFKSTFYRKFYEELLAYFPLIQQGHAQQLFYWCLCIHCNRNMITKPLPTSSWVHTHT